jgi:hypothetical protein
MVGWARIATAAALVAAAGPVAADDLELSFDAGRVTVVAAAVPLVTILDEWARLGDTRFVAAHGLPARPVSVRMVDVPEREALRVLLRAAGGYIAESRSTRQPGVSAFERVLIMAGGRRPARSRAGADQFQAPAPRPTQPLEMPRGPAAAAAPGAGVEPDEDEDEELDDLELLESLRRRYESAAEPAGDARPTFFPLPAPGAPTVPGPLTAPQPGMIMQPEDPAPQPRRPSSRPRRRTGAP